jgi:peroxiredoxin
MSRKAILFIILIAATISLAAIFYKVYLTRQQEYAYQDMPDLMLRDISGNLINLRAPANTKFQYRLLNYFEPDCEHCQNSTRMILKNQEEFSNTEIFMISRTDIQALRKFNAEFGIKQMPNISIFRDSADLFAKYFNYPTVPSFFIYKDNRQVKKVIGETKVSNLISQ